MSNGAVVLARCGDVAVPDVFATGVPVHDLGQLPTRDDVAGLLADAPTRLLVVAGGRSPDAALAAVLTALLRAERLDVELGYVVAQRTPATRAWGLATGEQAARRALHEPAQAVALVRDETGQALVGRAVLTGVGGAPLTGEAYADDVRLFSGKVRAVELTPSGDGVGASVRVGLRRRRATARAVQLGCTGAELVRDGVTAPRPVRRSTFYRHVLDWQLVG